MLLFHLAAFFFAAHANLFISDTTPFIESVAGISDWNFQHHRQIAHINVTYQLTTSSIDGLFFFILIPLPLSLLYQVTTSQVIVEERVDVEVDLDSTG